MRGPYPGELRIRVIHFVETGGIATWGGRTIPGQCQFGDPLDATLSRRWGLRTNGPWREHFPLGEVFAADPRPDPRAAGPDIE
jgi:hypothetical protein